MTVILRIQNRFVLVILGTPLTLAMGCDTQQSTSRT
jgi:hypothetical protein